MTNIYAKYLKSKQIIFLINNKTTTITNLVYVTSNDKIILSSAMVAGSRARINFAFISIWDCSIHGFISRV